MDGRLWHHLNEKEIWPNQGVFSEWMKFQSRSSCLRGEGSAHFCINSHGRSHGLGWWVKQAVTSDLTLSQWSAPETSTEAASSQLFHSCLRQWGLFNWGILRVARTRLVGSVITFIEGEVWLPALWLLVLRNLFCSFVHLYHTTFGYTRRMTVNQLGLRNMPRR